MVMTNNWSRFKLKNQIFKIKRGKRLTFITTNSSTTDNMDGSWRLEWKYHSRFNVSLRCFSIVYNISIFINLLLFFLQTSALQSFRYRSSFFCWCFKFIWILFTGVLATQWSSITIAGPSLLHCVQCSRLTCHFASMSCIVWD